jgi:SAM-dependent methyltransferase
MIKVTSTDKQHLKLPWSFLVANKGEELWIKATGKQFRGAWMIGARFGEVLEGFDSLKDAAFDRYNLPQVWVERRQIPEAIDGRVPDRGAVVLDLGCGPGTSTEVLCHFAQPCWKIIGFDLTDHLVERARMRSAGGDFRNREGEVISPKFECQDISKPLKVDGERIAEESVDFAVSCGVVGLYLSKLQGARLAKELHRVLRPGGHAAVDSGPAIRPRVLRRLMEDVGFELVDTAKSCWMEPRPKLVFVRN